MDGFIAGGGDYKPQSIETLRDLNFAIRGLEKQ